MGNREAASSAEAADANHETAELTQVIEALRAEVTERKRAEERFRKLLEATPDAMIIVNEAGLIVLANAQAAALFGYSQEALVGQSVEILVPTRFHGKHVQHRASYSAEPLVRPMGIGLDLYAVCRDGSEFPAEISLSPLQTDEGILTLAAIRDITDRRQAEMALQQAYDELVNQVKDRTAGQVQPQKDIKARSNEPVGRALARFTNQLRAVADVSQQLNSLRDSDELLEQVVTLLQQRFGFDSMHIFLLDREERMLVLRAGSGETGKRLRKQDYRVSVDAEDKPVAQAARSGTIISVPDVVNEPRYLPNSLLPQTRSQIAVPLIVGNELLGVMEVQDNQPYRFSQSDVYIFSSLAGHIAIALHNAHLFEESRRAQEALQERTEALERSNEELEQFAYVASHDLQEPLRMVTSYMQLLARRYQGQLGTDADEFIAFAVDGASRMKELINDLLAFSRIGTRGKAFEPVDCEEVLVQALHDLRFTLEDSEAVVTYDPLPVVMADRGQLAQIFRNLAGNAIKFRSQRRPEVHVSASRENGEWLFSVRDNGIGIDPEYSERIFVLFQRLHGREEYQGTGIGLAICKKIVERHGGRIWVESEVGHGATFYFTLPVREMAEPEAEALVAARTRRRPKDRVARRAKDLI